MTEKKKEISTMSVDDLLASIKAPEHGEKVGKCVLIKKIEKLPANVYEALLIAFDNKDVTNRDLLSFINNKTKIQVNLANLQAHRSKAGCIVCMYGAATK